MPVSRYEIRNEYSLADPELYRAADKDDPEALLEGVAMAGLVGVLRQLGDLAEFAAEIFHNLHEEVMATAARGHGLIVRVQQLETEVPSIEKAFLSQTDHSSFFYHPGSGVHWHPRLQIDQNLITRGDLPRFVMDSYEKCRPPPRLFLLDKFDVAGAGSCLKRYTDPSFFKVETSGMTNEDVLKEKKIRKAKKKGARLKNGETTEVLPTSHTKLHQLLQEEERIESGVPHPTRRAKLKRELNGFPFNSKSGDSYMEKLLQFPDDPDHKVIHEVSSMSATYDHNESGLEIGEVRLTSDDDGENLGTKRSPPSPDREENMINSSIYMSSEVAIDDKICEVRNLYTTPSIAIGPVGGISSSIDMTGEKVIAMDAESSREDTLIGYQSDDIVSELDNYVDATSTMESDTDADSRLRMKSESISSRIKIEPLISDANEEILQTGSFDSQSIGDSTISDEGNNSSRKEMSVFSSDSPSISAENPQFERNSSKGFSEHVVIDYTCPSTDAITNHTSDYEQLTSSLCSSESISTLVCSDSVVVGKDMLEGPLRNKMDPISHDKEMKSNLVMDPSCSSCVYDSDFQSGDELNGESIPPSISTVPYIHHHTADSSDNVTSDLVPGIDSDHEDKYSVENIAFSFNSFHSPEENGAPNELNFSENLIPGKLDDENLSNDLIVVQNGDSVEPMVAKEEKKVIVGLDNEDSGVSTDYPNQSPCSMETFLQQKLQEKSSANAHSTDAEDSRQIFPENLVLCHLENSFDCRQAGIDASDGDVIPEEATTLNQTCALGTPESFEVLGLLGNGISSSAPGELEEVTEIDAIFNGQEVSEISGSADVKSPDEVHIPLAEPDSGECNLYTAAVPEVSDNLIIDKLVEEHINLPEDFGIDELENGKSSLAEKFDNDNPKLEALGAVLNTNCDLEDDHDLQLVHPEVIQPPIEQNLLKMEHESEKSVVQNEIESLPSQFCQVLLNSSEITSEVSPVLTIDHEKMPDDDDYYPKLDNYTDLPRLINFDIDVSSDQFDSILHPSNPFSKTNQINLADTPPLPPLPPVQWMTGKLQHAELGLFSQFISHPDVSTSDARFSPSSIEEMKHSPSQIAKQEKIESPRVEVNAVHETVDLPPMSESKLKQIVIPSEFISPAEEDGNANGSRTGKSPRPRHPLIDEFAALDKSKLRKVTERVRPEIPKVEERDSLLEQIRTKSFNLRPSLTSRPSIRGPNTNLKVAAIVERANAIRQALAGSDEDDDDDDDWSDS